MPDADHPYALPERPNVIWVFGDQHRGHALSCAGDPNVSTPNVDRLAAEGVWFRRAVMGFPLCCPARGAILTGVYPHRCVPAHQARLPADVPTLAGPLQAAGYHTAYFGKWHLDGGKEEGGNRLCFHDVPRDRRGGFDTWIGYENNNAQFDCHVHGHRDDAEVERYRLPTFETDALTDLLLEHVSDHVAHRGEQPFFAALSVQPPHDPYTAPARWMGRHHPARLELRPNVPDIPRVVESARRDLAGYYALIENLDWNLGRVRDRLAELGLADDTLIVFFSDHGDHHGSHGHERKMTPYEEAIHVPMIVGGPCRFHYKWRHHVDVPFNHVDVAPTTLGLCGIDPPDAMQGFDHSGVVRPERVADPAAVPDAALLQCVTPTGHGPSVDRPWRGLRTRDRWKYVCFEGGVPWLMFDLDEDPYEQRNLAHHAHAARQRNELHERLRAMLADVGDGFAV